MPRRQQRRHAEPPAPAEDTDHHATALQRIYDDEIEAMAREAYQRDYEAFGFADWAAR